MKFRLCLVLLCSALLSGCGLFGTRISAPSVPDIHNVLPDADASTWWDYIAYSASALAGIGFLIGVLMLASSPKKAQQVIVSAIALLVGAQIMLFIGAYLVWIAGICLVVGLVAVSYRHKDKVVDYLDGDTEIIEKPHDL